MNRIKHAWLQCVKRVSLSRIVVRFDGRAGRCITMLAGLLSLPAPALCFDRIFEPAQK